MEQEMFDSRIYIKELIDKNTDIRDEYHDEFNHFIKERNKYYKKIQKLNEESVFCNKKLDAEKSYQSYHSSAEYSQKEQFKYDHIILYLHLLYKKIPVSKFYIHRDDVVWFHQHELEFWYEWVAYNEKEFESSLNKIKFHLEKLKELDAA